MTKAQSKASVVRKLLSRGKGATLIEIGKVTGWQPHSCRAFLTGIRKADSVSKEERADGAVAYRLMSIRQNQADEGFDANEEAVSAKAVEETAGKEAASQ